MDIRNHFVALERNKSFSMEADLVQHLEDLEFDFLEYRDITDGNWHLDIATDDPYMTLSMVFNKDKEFLHMHLVHGGIKNLDWAIICSAFAAQQFDYLEHHRGTTVFPLSRMNERRDENCKVGRYNPD